MKPLLLALFLLAFPHLATGQSYTVTDLAAFSPLAINNSGQIISAEGVWDKGKIVSFGSPRNFYAATALNNRGQVVGTSGLGLVVTFTDMGDVHAFLWQNEKSQKLKLPQGFHFFSPLGINNRGEVVGYASGGPALWNSDHMTYLSIGRKFPGHLGFFVAKSINDAGLICGTSDMQSNNGDAVLWQNGHLKDLGSFPKGRVCEAIAINNAAQIIGDASLPQTKQRYACLWQKGKWSDLGKLPGDKDSAVAALNNSGEIVGQSYLPQAFSRQSCAFLWRHGKMLNLNAFLPPHSNWQFDSATGINDRGQIVGKGLHHGKRRGYLLTPKV